MMDEIIEPIEIKEDPKRPTFLKVLCILSFVSIGVSGIATLFSTISGPVSDEEMLETRAKLYESSEEMRSSGMTDLANLFEQMQRMNESLNDHFYAVALVSILVIAIGFVGVFFMWQGRKLGFHLYILYSLMSIGNIYLFVEPVDIPNFVVIWNLLISGIFILLYSRNLVWMNK